MLRSGCGRWASEPTAEDLKDLAIGMVGHRRMLLKAIANLRTAPAVSAPDPAAGAAAGSYARLLRDQGRTGEAYELLAPVYGWFTEGFATKDPKDGKALPEELETSGAPAPG
jgi:predicted ATPase